MPQATLNFAKDIPAKTIFYKISWYKEKRIRNDPAFRSFRSVWSDKNDYCFCCDEQFSDYHMMTLAHVNGVGNKFICDSCINKLKVLRGLNNESD